MSKDSKPTQKRIDQFFSGPGGRADDWRDLVDAAKVWSRGGDRAKYDAALANLSVTEEFHGYPGLHLMGALREAAAAGDAATSATLVTRITQALTTRSFRQHTGDWDLHDDGNGDIPEMLPPTFGGKRASTWNRRSNRACPKPTVPSSSTVSARHGSIPVAMCSG